MKPLPSKSNQINSTKQWPADTVQRRQLSELIPYAKNARTHTDKQIDQIVASMREWGWTNPVLIDESGSIIAGHGRVLAAKKLGITSVPVMVATDWTEAQKRAYVIADNKIAENADWDGSKLSDELSWLSDIGFDMELTGFDQIEAQVSAENTVRQIDVSKVEDGFWISITGPLRDQALVLQQLRSVLSGFPDVDVELGTVADNPL